MKILEGCSQATQDTMSRCLDTFGGADGGVGFIRLCTFLRDIEKKADEGNTQAQELVRMVHQFGRLLEVV